MPDPERPSRGRAARVLALVALVAVGGAAALVLLLRGTGTPPAVTDLASRLGCTGFAPAARTEVFVREQGTCQVGGASVTIYTFATGQSRNGWLNTASSFGGIYVVGAGWVVAAGTQQVADLVHGRLGGDIR
jgi:hypothetical protein